MGPKALPPKPGGPPKRDEPVVPNPLTRENLLIPAATERTVRSAYLRFERSLLLRSVLHRQIHHR